MMKHRGQVSASSRELYPVFPDHALNPNLDNVHTLEHTVY